MRSSQFKSTNGRNSSAFKGGQSAFKQSGKQQQLWGLLDEYKNFQDAQNETINNKTKNLQGQQHIEGIKKQLEMAESAKKEQEMAVHKEKEEVQQSLLDYERYKRQEKEKKEQQRIKLFEMMQYNIQNHKNNQQKERQIDKATDHLVNPANFQAMDQNGIKRMKASRARKMVDDVQNIK